MQNSIQNSLVEMDNNKPPGASHETLFVIRGHLEGGKIMKKEKKKVGLLIDRGGYIYIYIDSPNPG